MQPVSSGSRLAVEWITQLRDLQRSLQQSPQHSLAWRWRINAKVLTYLVLRYGDDPMLDLKSSVRVPLTIPTLGDIDHRRSSPLRSRRELKGILARIAEINLFKAELAPSRHDRILHE